MRSIKEIKADIADIEQVIQFGDESDKKNMSPILAELKKELADAESKTDATAKPKVASKKESNPNLNPKYKVGDVFYRKSGKEIEIKSVRSNKGTHLYQLSDSSGFVKESTVDRLLKNKPAKKEDIKKEVASAKVVKDKQKAKKNEGFTWRKKLDSEVYEGLEDVVVAQTFKKYVAKDKIKVEVKQEASKGDVVLINEDGHPTKVMTSTMAEQHLRKGKFDQTYVRKETADKKDKEIAFLRKKVDELTGEKDKAITLFKKSNAAKRAARKRKQEKPVAKPTVKKEKSIIEDVLGTIGISEQGVSNNRYKPKPEAKPKAASPAVSKQAAKPKPKSDADQTGKPKSSTTQKAKKRTKCTAEEYDAVEIMAKVVAFLEDNAMQFHSIFSQKRAFGVAKEIMGVYATRGEKSKIIVKLKNHRKGFFSSPEEWHSLCLDSWKLTKIPAPGPNTYRKVIDRSKLQKIYNTKGAKQWMKCLEMYRELYQCQKDGNCTAADKEKYRKIYDNCGNLARKLNILPDQMQILFKKAKEIRQKKSGIKYNEAMREAAIQLRKSEAKS